MTGSLSHSHIGPFKNDWVKAGFRTWFDKIASALESLGPGDGTLDYLGLQCLQRLFLVGRHGRYAVAESR